MGVSNKLETAMGMSIAATTFVLTLASACSYLTYTWLLVPLGPHLPAHDQFYPGDCGGRAVHRNGGPQNEPAACTGCSGVYSAADHHQLRRAWAWHC